MRVKYRPETDTALIELVEGVPDVEGEEVADGVIVHFDEDDRPVRIEIYDAARSKLAGIPFAGATFGESDDELALAVAGPGSPATAPVGPTQGARRKDEEDGRHGKPRLHSHLHAD